MKLQQLRFVWEVSRQGLNVTAAAEVLHTSQPGVSKQIRQLEDELGVQIFVRAGKQFVGITPAGQTIIELAGRTVAEADNIKRAARDHTDPRRGSLAIATTHTQARYWLPPRIASFIRRYPDVRLHMHQGSPMQIAELAADGTADLAIATEAMEHFADLVMLPLYTWNRSVVVPCEHPLRNENPLTLDAVARFPIVTYVFGFTGRSHLDAAFRSHGLTPNVVFTATDADVIKAYVRLGLGVGIVARMAYEPRFDTDLCALEASHLFESSTTKVGLKRGVLLRRFQYDFLELLAPHLTRAMVDAALACRSQSEVDALFELELPAY